MQVYKQRYIKIHIEALFAIMKIRAVNVCIHLGMVPLTVAEPACKLLRNTVKQIMRLSTYQQYGWGTVLSAYIN